MEKEENIHTHGSVIKNRLVHQRPESKAIRNAEREFPQTSGMNRIGESEQGK